MERLPLSSISRARSGRRPRPAAGGWLPLAALALAAALLAACSSSQGSEGGVHVQPLASATATIRPAPSATKAPPSPTPEPPTPTTAPATATAEPAVEATLTPAPEPPTAQATLAPAPEPPTATPAPPWAVPSPTATPIGTALLRLVPPEIGQGQTTTVEVAGQGAASAVAFADNISYPLLANGTDFWGVIAAAGDAAAGVHAITVQLLDGNGNVMSELTTQVTVDDMSYPVENIDLPPAVNESLDPALIQQEDDARAATFAQFTPQKLWSGPFIWPVQPVVVASPYGIRRSYNGGPVSSFHGGIDLAADEGTPVVAANSGRVAWVGTGPDYGNTVLIDHGDGVFSGYSHLSAIAVQAGQMINKGDLVGNVGSTGMATGPHVHWEIDVRGVPVDPGPWTLQTVGP
jgi:murein DD-endopeptidase MepM/ murein hydrolase activator NlpD